MKILKMSHFTRLSRVFYSEPLWQFQGFWCLFFPIFAFPRAFQVHSTLILSHSTWMPRGVFHADPRALSRVTQAFSICNFLTLCSILAFPRVYHLKFETYLVFHSTWMPCGFFRADPRALTRVSQVYVFYPLWFPVWPFSTRIQARLPVCHG